MPPLQPHPLRGNFVRKAARACSALLLALVLLAPGANGDDSATVQTNRERAKILQSKVQTLIRNVRPAVVSIFASGPSETGPGFRQGSGSGVLISADGFVLTNHHVAGWAESVSVTLTGRRVLPAKVIGSDPGGDLVLLKIEAEGALPFATFGDSNALQSGAWVFAMGNPRGVSPDGRAIVTWGTVTAVNRLGGNPRGRRQFYGDAIQTDAEINPGNSGGPLFDMNGKLVGINGRIATTTQLEGNLGAVNARVGYSIPTSQIQRFLPLLMAGGTVRHGYLGVRTTALDNGDLAVSFVIPGSGAEKSGIAHGDILLAIDGEKLTGRIRLTNLVSSRPEGQRVAVRVRRGDEERIFVVALGARPEDEK